MLKCQFHIHTKGDAIHNLDYDPKDLIKEAKKLNYDVLAITCHRRVLFSKHLQKYAAKKGILLLPGIEMEIKKQHILVLNAHEDIYKVASFDELRHYKKEHPESFLIAPHPFFPGSMSLKKNLITNVDLFDAIEYSFFYSKNINFNLPAIKISQKYNKTMVATSDCHILPYLDQAHCLIDAKKKPEAIFQAIRENRVKNIHKPLKIGELIDILFKMFITIPLRSIFQEKPKFSPPEIDFSNEKC